MKNRPEIAKQQLGPRIQIAGVNLAVGFQRNVVFRARDCNRGVDAILEKQNVFGVRHLPRTQCRTVIVAIENDSESG